MASWHQQQARRRAYRAGQPLRLDSLDGWTVVHDAPNVMTTCMVFKDRAEAEAFSAKLPHSYILPPRKQEG